MIRVLVDTNVFVYALGAPGPYRQACRSIVHYAAVGLLRPDASVDLIQELLHQRTRRTGDRAFAAKVARRVTRLCDLHAPTAADIDTALTLFEAHPRLQARDALFAATALNRDIGVILSADQDFDGIPGLRRVDPLDEAAVAALVD